MNLKVGIGFFMFCAVAALWALWAWQSDPDRAGRLLIIAIGATAIALFLLTSRRMTAWFKEAEKKLEIDEYRERQAERGQEIRAAFTRSSGPETDAGVTAIADPRTATALSDLEKLLYTRVISQAEFTMAKERLFRSPSSQSTQDTIELLEKLADLHEAGVLSEVEFTAAKLKALGLK